MYKMIYIPLTSYSYCQQILPNEAITNVALWIMCASIHQCKSRHKECKSRHKECKSRHKECKSCKSCHKECKSRHKECKSRHKECKSRHKEDVTV